MTSAVVVAESVAEWLGRFEHALTKPDNGALKSLFHSGSHWRDILALTCRIRTLDGADAIVRALSEHSRRAQPAGFRVDPHRAAPRTVTRAGTECIEAIFRFDTVDGRGSGVLRLTPDLECGNAPKAWTLLTSLDELSMPEKDGGRSPESSKLHSRDFRGPNWLDLRKAAAAYTDRDPAVLVVGGGQAGLSIAARLTHMRVDTLVVDRETRVGDNWRNRYHALTLHNQTKVNHLPYMHFPSTWPTYIPKDKLASWFEAYVEGMEINYWTGTEFGGGEYNEREGRWSVVLRRADGTTRQMHPRHIVMATGVSGIPNLPDLPTLRAFEGAVLHSSQ